MKKHNEPFKNVQHTTKIYNICDDVFSYVDTCLWAFGKEFTGLGLTFNSFLVNDST